jgi:hypothetical protein
MEILADSANLNELLAKHSNDNSNNNLDFNPNSNSNSNLNISLENSEKPKKKKKPRCPVCKKKLGLMPYTCKCNMDFCVNHIQPELHVCSYDHKKAAKDILSERLVKVVAQKIIPI